MDTYFTKVQKLEKDFHGLEFHHIMCDLNVATDILAILGSNQAQVLGGVFVQELTKSSIKEQTIEPVDTQIKERQIMVIISDWTQVLIDYILHHKLLEDKVQAE